ncbi:M23 family metallopeptidase [Myxococcota bacterium]|nr:M23 family metallopeptidase [Myxococcota bacterium]MBU1429507.1 M23 family metallopeptidase [Myxococcota bacterium]MBU1896184.1 M23 family metallopeptidase [Myxococcota bacterium]
MSFERLELKHWIGGGVVLSLAIALVLGVSRCGDAPLSLQDAGPSLAPPDAAAPAAPPSSPSVDAARAAPPPSPPGEARGVLERGETLSAALTKHGATPQHVHQIVAALKGVYDFRYAKPGAPYLLKLKDGALRVFRFEHSPVEIFEVSPDAAGGLVGRAVEVQLRAVEAEVVAPIHSSLYAALQRAGEGGALVSRIIDAFAWDMDFFKDTQPGDEVRVIVEKIYKDEAFVRYGDIIAAEYNGKAGRFRAFRFPKVGGDFYLEDGQSARKTFLATPLKFTRVSSGFGKRKHPVTGFNKKHLGVDYAAPRGTPVWAMAAGTIKFAGEKGYNGNLIVIEHSGGLTSLYAHLHTIRRGIKRGVKVKQKQLIGTVGSTGRSTGPHLHFGVKHNGKHVNPQKLKMTRGAPVKRQEMPAFKAHVAALSARLAAMSAPSASPEPVDEALGGAAAPETPIKGEEEEDTEEED